MGPDLVHRQLGPVGDLRVLGRASLVLHDLELLEQLLHEVQSTVVLPGQHEALKNSW